MFISHDPIAPFLDPLLEFLLMIKEESLVRKLSEALYRSEESSALNVKVMINYYKASSARIELSGRSVPAAGKVGTNTRFCKKVEKEIAGCKIDAYSSMVDSKYES